MLKLSAFTLMTVDHVGMVFGSTTARLFGRVAFPLFAYMVAVNYRDRTRDRGAYLLRLFVLALISQGPYIYFFSSYGPNVIFILWGGLVLTRFNPWLSIPALLGLALIFPGLGFLPVFLVVACYFARDFYLLCAAIILYFLMTYNLTGYVLIFSVASLGFMFLDQARVLAVVPFMQSRVIYFYYPMHIMILAVIK